LFCLLSPKDGIARRRGLRPLLDHPYRGAGAVIRKVKQRLRRGLATRRRRSRVVTCPGWRTGCSAAGSPQGHAASSESDDLHSPLRSQARRREASDGDRSARSRSSRAACRLAKARSRITRVGYFGFQ
jgi:hypothetical protein